MPRIGCPLAGDPHELSTPVDAYDSGATRGKLSAASTFTAAKIEDPNAANVSQ